MNYADDSSIEKKPRSASATDDKSLLDRLLQWLSIAEGSTSESNWRLEAKESYDFYAGKQDDPDIVEELSDLNRPVTVYNEVKPKIDMLIGLASQNKKAPLAFPVERNDEAIVELINGAFKFYRREARVPRNEIECFEHTVKSGRSLLYFYTGGDNPFEPEIKTKRIAGRDFWLDPRSVEYDMSDARFLFIDKWYTEGEIIAYFPDLNPAEIKGLSQSHPDAPAFWSQERELYRVTECWYREFEYAYWVQNPVTGSVEALLPAEYKAFVKQVLQGVNLPDGSVYQSDSVEHVKKMRATIKYAIFSNTKILFKGRTPYKHNYFPGVLFGAYKDEDENKWFSAVEMMKDPQRSLNTMKRQFQHLLQTSPKGILMHETGAVVDIEEYEERSAEPNYHMEISPGKFDKVKFTDQPQISPVYGQLVDEDRQAIKNASGIQDSLMGVQTSSREPGITARMRQETGLAVLFLLFDNYRESRMLAGKVMLSMMQQYCTKERLIRIEGEEGAKLLQLNSQSNPDAKDFNDISVGKYDLVLDETLENQTMRMAILQMLADYGQQNPNSIPPDLIMEYSDLPFTAKQRVKEYNQMMMQREDARIQAQLAVEQEKTMREDAFKRLELAVTEGIARMEAQVKLIIADKQASKVKESKEKGEE